MSEAERIQRALDLAVRYGGIDGVHHKAWVIDQMVRALTDSPMVTHSAIDCNGVPYTYETLGESPTYLTLIADAKGGEDGPDAYGWDCGIPP